MTISGVMASNGNYPDNNGVSVGQTSTIQTGFKTLQLHRVSILINGSPDSNALYKVQVLTVLGNWVDSTIQVSGGPGYANGTVEGVAVRLAAANGTSPGTGNNTPGYEMEIEHLRTVATGK